MRILLSTIGSRGDVQPLVGLALQLKELGQDPRLCVPPDFIEWIASLGLSATPIGPEVGKAQQPSPVGGAEPPSPEQIRQMVEGTVAAQFATITAAAAGCDAIVGATALQIAAPSVAEKLRIPYIFAAYCPAVLPSPHHAPPPLISRGEKPAPPNADKRALWARDAARFDETFREPLNAHRASEGLPPIDEVRRHIFTEHPWLAADPVLAPWPDPSDDAVFQPGAWILRDERPLPPELRAFLDAGDPPIYFGFGSVRAAPQLGHAMVEAARALGRRAIVLRGWAGLSLPDEGSDCLAIGEVNQQALFPRVAAVVHHGGAGTTTAAAAGGSPQVVTPQLYDQHYHAERVERLGVGFAHPLGVPTAESLTGLLEKALRPEARTAARSLAGKMRRDGALIAARRLVAMSRQ
jgi:vancomycin aglycone glucosyltransferase